MERAHTVRSMCTIQIVNPAEWIPHIRDLLSQNWAETGLDFDFDPDIDVYARMAELGMLFAVAAFDGPDIVGYCTVTVMAHPHNKRVIFGSNDALFVHPNYRAGLVPGRVILTAQAEAKRRGAIKFMWHCRAGTPLAAMFERHGYEPVDMVVMKEI
jgi:GNAT superfamily N-acetyltransferase